MTTGLSISLPARAVASISGQTGRGSAAEEYLLSLYSLLDQDKKRSVLPSLPALPALPGSPQRGALHQHAASPLRSSATSTTAKPTTSNVRSSGSRPTAPNVVKATELSAELKQKLLGKLRLQQAKESEYDDEEHMSPMKRPLARSSSSSPLDLKRPCPGPVQAEHEHIHSAYIEPAASRSPSTLPSLPSLPAGDSLDSSTSLFVGDLPTDSLDANQIRAVLFERCASFGAVLSVHLVPLKNFAFVRFALTEQADAALQALGGAALFDGYPPQRMRKAHPARSDSR